MERQAEEVWKKILKILCLMFHVTFILQTETLQDGSGAGSDPGLRLAHSVRAGPDGGGATREQEAVQLFTLQPQIQFSSHLDP